MYDKVKAFLRLDSMQDALADNNLEYVYTMWRRQGGNPKFLSTFFIQRNIMPLDYMAYVPEESFKGISISIIDLSDKNIEQIGSQAFEENYTLYNLNLGNVKYIGVAAFSGCTSLQKLNIPSSLDSIDDDAFSYCDLQELHIPKTVRRIGLKAFSHNNSLNKVTTEHTVEDFKNVCCGDKALDYVFFNCNYLDEVICSDGTITIHH